MECKTADSLIMKFMDKTITKKEAERLNKHTEKCRSCKSDLALYNEIASSLADAEICDAPSGFELRVAEKIRDINIYGKKLSAKMESFTYAALGALAIVVALAFTLVGNRAAILGYMSETPSLAGIASFLTPIVALMESYISNLGATIGGFLGNAGAFLNSTKYIFLASAAVLVLAQVYLSKRKKDRINA